MIDKWTAPYQRYLQPRGDPSPQPLSALSHLMRCCQLPLMSLTLTHPAPPG